MTSATRDAIQTKIDRINAMIQFNGIPRKLKFNGEQGVVAIRLCKPDAESYDGWADIKTISYRKSKETILFLDAYESGMEILDKNKI